MTRRGFFGAIGAVAVAAVVPPARPGVYNAAYCWTEYGRDFVVTDEARAKLLAHKICQPIELKVEWR